MSDKGKDSDTEVADTSDEESDELPHDDEKETKKLDEDEEEEGKKKDGDDSPPVAASDKDEDEKLSIKIDHADEEEGEKADSEHSSSDSDSDSDKSDGGRATSVISRESTMVGLGLSDHCSPFLHVPPISCHPSCPTTQETCRKLSGMSTMEMFGNVPSLGDKTLMSIPSRTIAYHVNNTFDYFIILVNWK